MTTTELDPAVVARLREEYAKRLNERAAAMLHPAGLLDHVKCIDAKTGEKFAFTLNDPEAGWYWQREVLDDWLTNPLNLVLKARQIGITWLASPLIGATFAEANVGPLALCMLEMYLRNPPSSRPIYMPT